MTFDQIDFIIIGAAKSATTSMQRALQSDPGVFMPDPELHFFSREFHRGEKWYLDQFAGTSERQIAGEKSNSYLDTREAPSLIKAAMPNVRLIAQLRNPVERAYSDYCMLYRRAEVGRDIENHLNPKHAETGRFLQGGLYCSQLEHYYDRFPAENISIYLFEDFKLDPMGQLRDVRNFIGPGENKVKLPPKVKDKTAPMLSPELRRKAQWLKPILTPLRKTSVFTSVRRMLVREVSYSPLTSDLRNRMIDFYLKDVEKLGRLMNRDLSHWLTETPSASNA
jgi:Sulfotransferase domain